MKVVQIGKILLAAIAVCGAVGHAAEPTDRSAATGAIRPRLWANLKPGEVFKALAEPPDRYRSVPWLAWTGNLDWPLLEQQLGEMKAQGITEFILFPLYGMELPYMSAAYWQRVGQTLEYCRAHGMKCWIYDDYNWPSGVNAGEVTRDFPEAREQLLWVRLKTPDRSEPPRPPLVTDCQQNGEAIWAVVPYSGVRTNVRGSWWNNRMPGYLDVLSFGAVGRFIGSSHDRYYGKFPAAFPATLPGFFSDEPGLDAPLFGGGGGAWFCFPYTGDLFEDFRRQYGYDLRERLNDLITGGPVAERTRCHYWRWISERFGAAYGGQIRKWCDARGVAVTAHFGGEEDLIHHVRRGGDMWEALKNFTIPGMDMLANADAFNYPHRVSFAEYDDRRGFNLTCAMLRSIARHSGSREVMSEAYGICDWGMNLFRQRCGFNYQVASGVTMFVDSSLITSIADFRKYAISGKHFTQPWWQNYKRYADYNARIAALHAEGEQVADVAVLYPRSTIWARTDGAVMRAKPVRGQPLGDMQELLCDTLDELVRQQWHFDFIFEPVLETAHIEGQELVTEHARYRALVIPDATLLPRKSLDRLRAFADAGGIVIFAGGLPQREVDSAAGISGEIKKVLANARVRNVAGTGAAVCEALSSYFTRAVTLSGPDAREFISSHRRLADHDFLFVAHMGQQAADVNIAVNVKGTVTFCDPDTLERYRPAANRDGSYQWHFEPWQALLVVVDQETSGSKASARLPAAPAWLHPLKTEVLDGEWQFAVEPGNMLRLTVEARPDPENIGAAEGWQRDRGNTGWTVAPENRLTKPIRPDQSPWYWLRARVKCDAGAKPRRLVVDNPDFIEVFVNGRPAEPVNGTPVWTEENLHFNVEGMFKPGENWVHIRARTSKYNDPRMGTAAPFMLQPVVVLGEFEVAAGEKLVAWRGSIRADAPWERQGLPHVAGVGVYRRTIRAPAADHVWLQLPGCSDAVEVFVNNQSCGIQPWPPYVFDLSRSLHPGDNALEVRVRNTLGNIITARYRGAQVAPENLPTSGLTAAPRLLLTN